MTTPLMAKSGDPSQTARTLVGHTRNVLDAVHALFGEPDRPTRFARSWIRFFGLEESDHPRFLLHLRIAAAAHDWGKANEGFQNLLAGRGPQIIRHEHVSTLLLADRAILAWLRRTGVDAELILASVLGHHVKAGRKEAFALIPAPGAPTLVRILADHPDFQALLELIAAEVGSPLPNLASPKAWREADLDERGRAAMSALRLLSSGPREAPTRHRLLNAVRTALIAADAVGSAEPRLGTDLADWIATAFADELTGADIEENVIGPRKKQLRERNAWDDAKGFSRFQVEVADQGPRVLLTAPCGSGKTLAAWNWIKARLDERPAARVVFLYPTRATATEGFRDYVSWAPEADASLMSGTAAYELDGMFGAVEDDRKGRDYRPDPRLFALGHWRKRIFSATVDQFFPFLHYAYGPLCMLPILAESVLVVDEVHSFSASMFSTLKHFLAEFPSIPVLCMAATLPRERRDDLVRLCGLKPFPETIPDDLSAVADHPRYEIRWIDPQDVEHVTRRALDDRKRILRVCNRVDDCRTAFTTFWEEPLPDETPTAFCYHSRFRLVDRKARHQALVHAFQDAARNDGARRPVYGATTQVCEMSLDLDAEILITDLAPISSLIQRMGRCNRDSRKLRSRPPGLVYVVRHGETTSKPYEEDELAAAAAFVDALVALERPISQTDLDSTYATHDVQGVEPLKHSSFVSGDPFACAGEDPFREIDESTTPCVLDVDVAEVERRLREKRPIDEFLVPVPLRHAEPPGVGSKLPKYLKIAPTRLYCKLSGFDGRPEPPPGGDADSWNDTAIPTGRTNRTKAAAGRADPESVELTFDLDDLPTTQHRAGLAGLLMQIESMKDRKVPDEKRPVVDRTRTSARVRFTAESTQALFDDLYAAKREEVWSPSKWAGAEPLNVQRVETVDPKTGKTKTVQKFQYEVVVPTATCLERHATAADGPWLKLWRDMVWTIPRGINTTRVPFNQRADGEPCAEGAAAWRAIVDFVAGLKKSEFATSPISSALMLAAQSENAESVKFLGRVDHNLLLHFWQVVVVTYIPYQPDFEGKMQAAGFVLALPDVADLQEFPRAFAAFLAELRQDRHPGLKRWPEAAFIDVPIQSNLEFLRHLLDLANAGAGREAWSWAVSAVESFHMLKAGNNVKLLAMDRVNNRPDLVAKYEYIKKSFRNPLFRATLLQNLLADRPWHGGMLDLFAERPWAFFVEHEKTPRFIPRFGADARARFQAIRKDYQGMSEDEIPTTDRLSRIVWRLMGRYVDGRAEAKTGLEVKTFPKSSEGDFPDYPPKFREAQQKVCQQAFLDMRSRHDRDFVEYFAGSICSVGQYLPQADYQFLTSILMSPSQKSAVGETLPCWEDVKSLAMIAASARSFAVRPRDRNADAEQNAVSTEPASEES